MLKKLLVTAIFEIEIKKCVRQGCMLSPILLRLYSQDIINSNEQFEIFALY